MPIWIQHWWVWFTAIFAITFLSFWPSFFSAIVNIETHIIIHGVSAIAWMLLIIIQAWLIKSGWRKYHRTVSYVSLTLAAVFDQDPGLRPDKHIFVELVPEWDQITDTLPQYDIRSLMEERMGKPVTKDFVVRSHNEYDER